MNRSFWFCTGKSCTVCSRPFHRCGKTAITLPTLGAPSWPVIRQIGGSIYTATLHRASEMKLQTSANGARRGVFRACVPVELRGRAGTLTKIVELLRFRWIEESGRGESIDEEIVANAPV